MILLKALQQGFKQTWRYKTIVFFLYFLTVLLALLVAYPFKNLLESTVGHSMMIADLVKGFDYTFLNDFKNAYGTGLLPIIDQSIAVIVLYLLLFIFLTGGIIATFVQQPKQYNRRIFWEQSAHFFGPFLRLTLYFLIIHGIILGIFLFIFYTSSNGLSPFSLENEGTIAINFKRIVPCYILIAAAVFMWQDYTKIFLVQQPQLWIYQALWAALQFLWSTFRQSYGLYLINLGLWALVVWVHYQLTKNIVYQDSLDIWYSFLLSQLFILNRLIVKLINLSSAVALVQEKTSQNLS